MSQVADAGVPHWATWLGQHGGRARLAAAGRVARRAGARGTAARTGAPVFGWLGGLCPGLGLALGVAAVGRRGAHWLGTSVLGFEHSPVSAIMVASCSAWPSATRSACRRCTRGA